MECLGSRAMANFNRQPSLTEGRINLCATALPVGSQTPVSELHGADRLIRTRASDGRLVAVAE